MLSKEQLDILHHTRWRAAGNMYCGSQGDPDLRALVDLGFMRDCGTPSHLPDTDAYFTITREGRAALERTDG